MRNTPAIQIPTDLLPADGRFGSGPSKVRPEAVKALSEVAGTYLGTSHRQAPIRAMVSRLRSGIAEMFNLPDGYEVILGNGGTTLFWDALTHSFIENRSAHLVFGEFSSKFAAAAKAAPFLEDPVIFSSDFGTSPALEVAENVDLYALTHNETSTGVVTQVVRPRHSNGELASGLVAVDATSAAGGVRVDPTQFDCYYFAPQKGLASDGGLWIAMVSPAALERIETIAKSGRYIPASLDLSIALEQSRLDQTYNTPALATIFLAVQQIEWINSNGGLDFAAGRSEKSSEILYGWAERSDYAAPFVAKPDERSPVVGTIDLDTSLDAGMISGILRNNGIVDTESYRKLGRNQLRIAMFPAIEPADIEALTKCIDYVATQLR